MPVSLEDMKAIDSLEKFRCRSGEMYALVRLQKPDMLVCWRRHRSDGVNIGWESIKLGLLPVKRVDADNLKEIGVWSKLSAETKKSVEESIHEEKNAVRNRMAHARSKRRKKYDGMPAMLTCKCGREVKANYSQLQKKADAKNIPLMDLVKGYQCQKCNPTKGRRKKKK